MSRRMDLALMFGTSGTNGRGGMVYACLADGGQTDEELFGRLFADRLLYRL